MSCEAPGRDTKSEEPGSVQTTAPFFFTRMRFVWERKIYSILYGLFPRRMADATYQIGSIGSTSQ